MAADRARILLGCYRKGEASDPEVYTTAVISVLASFPEDIVVAVTDPVRGLPSESQFLPTIAEVRAACDRRMQPIFAALRRRREAEELRAILARDPNPPDEHEHELVSRGFDELRASIKSDRERARELDPAALLASYSGRSIEDARVLIDAMPDARGTPARIGQLVPGRRHA